MKKFIKKSYLKIITQSLEMFGENELKYYRRHPIIKRIEI